MDVAAWLRELGLERYREAFRDNEIDARILPKLTSDDLKEIGVGPVGHRRTLLEAIAALNQPERSHSASPPDAGPTAEAAGTRRSEAERRQLTVMFVDLVGSTELSRRLDPEDMSEVMRGYRGRTTEVIQRWGGHVAKYLGDGVLAYFGWPQAHEDDAERAVRAGLALSHAIAETDDGADGKLAARIGIATGPVVVGELVGEGSAKEEAVVGETPNLAARLQAAAAPGGLIVSATTRRLLGELFELDRIDGLQLKGFGDDPVPFRILGEGRSESRFEATRGRKLTPLVGREHELGLLLDRWSRAKDGEGQVVLLSGEAGIGKSRLLRALRERLLDEPHVALPHYGSAHHINSDFHPIVQHLERAAAFLREDPESVRLDKLEALLRPSGVELGRVVPLIAPLFGLDPSEQYPPLDLTPQRRRQLTLEALIAQVEALAREQPVLAIYEDVHWFDPSTIDAISLMIERVADLRVLVLIAFRPDFAPPWQGYGPTTLLSLSRLARRDGAGMIARLTGGQPLPHELEAELLARTDGIPLFVEELTKAVLESGLLHHTASGYAFSGSLPTLAIPASLQDSLMARLDRMAPVREVAQIAAVVGRDFDYRVLSAVVGMGDARLREALGQLVNAEIVFCRGAPPDAVFTFKHALLQEAAYGSLLHRNRRFLHERVAQVLEASSDAEAAVVAVHWAASLNHDKAVYYLLKAARRSLDRGALQEAKSHIESGLDHLDHLPTDANRDKTELEFKVMLGSASLTLLGPSAPETLATYERVLDLRKPATTRVATASPYTASGNHSRRGQTMARRLQPLGRCCGWPKVVKITEVLS